MNDMDILQVAYTHAKHWHDTNKKDFQCNFLFLLHMRPITWTQDIWLLVRSQTLSNLGHINCH